MIDTKFLKDVQAAGWQVEAAFEESVIAKCPAHGCNLRAELRQGVRIPQVDPSCQRDRRDVPIKDFDDLRCRLRTRREGLGLTIKEVEEIGGIASDHLAKFEKDETVRPPNAQTMIEWAQALGYEIVLRPGQMTSLGLRTIVDTRAKLESRKKRFKIEEKRRGG